MKYIYCISENLKMYLYSCFTVLQNIFNYGIFKLNNYPIKCIFIFIHLDYNLHLIFLPRIQSYVISRKHKLIYFNFI